MIAFLFGCAVGAIINAHWDELKEFAKEAHEEVMEDMRRED